MSTVRVNARKHAHTPRETSATLTSRARRIVARFSLVGVPLVAVYALLVVYEALTTSFRDRPLDASVYYAAATALQANPAANIYDPAVLAQAAHQHAGCALWTGASYLYPPLLAVLFEPFTALSCDQAIHYWMLCNLALWALCTALLVYWLHALLPPDATGTHSLRTRVARWLHGEPDLPLLATMGVIALSVLAWPVLQGLLMGQINLALLAALLCVPLLVRREQYIAAGMLLAFAAMLKLLPAILIIYYLFRGRWRVIVGAILGFVLLTGVVLITVRSPLLLDARAVVSSTYAQASSDNQALAHAPLWAAVELGAPAGAPLASLAGRVLLALAVLLFGAGLLALRRTEAVDRRGPAHENAAVTELLGYSWTVCAMVALSPLAWLHYNTWLLLPYVLAAGFLLRESRMGHPTGRPLALLFVSGALLFLPWSLPLDGPTYAPGPYVAGVALRPLLMLVHPAAVVLLWCIAGWSAWRSQRNSKGAVARSADPAPHDPLGEAKAPKAKAH